MRVILKDGDLYSVSDAFGEKRLTTNTNIKILFGNKHGKILFGQGWEGEIPETERGGSTTLFLMNEDGSQVQKITEEPVIGGFLDEKQKRIFYTTEMDDLYVSDFTGGIPKKLQSKVSGAMLAPDGKHFIYQKMHPEWTPGQFGDSALGLTVLDAETGEEKRITDKWEDFGAFWTPDGKRIVFFSPNERGLVSHFIMNADGSNRMQLTNIGQEFATDKTVAIPSEYPVWSPDGRSLLYESDRQIWINVFDASYNSIIDARPVAFGRDPQWSKDSNLSVVVSSGPRSLETVIEMDRKGKLLE